MAYPVGHSLVGVGLAIAVAQATGTPTNPEFFIGAAVASNLPDFDWIGVMAGLPLRVAHRTMTHSLITLSGVSILVGAVWQILPGGSNLGLGIAWGTALFSHLLVDLVTTSPGAARAGFGIPLLWPLSSKRWALQPPILATPDFNRMRSLKVLWKPLLNELCVFGPLFITLVFLSYLLRAVESELVNFSQDLALFPRMIGY